MYGTGISSHARDGADEFAGPKVNPKAFVLDKACSNWNSGTIAMIVITLLIISLLYVRSGNFWFFLIKTDLVLVTH